VCRAILNDFAAHFLHHVPEVHSGRTSGFTCATVETAKHVLHKRVSNLRPAFVKCAHHVDTAAWRIHFAPQHSIGGTRREAQPAMNAIEVERSLSFCSRSRHLILSIRPTAASLRRAS